MSPGSGPVRAYTVDELMRLGGIESVDLLKMDIETAEIEVLSNAEPWIGRVRMLVIETHDRFRPGCSVALERIASSFANRWKRGELDFLLRSASKDVPAL